MRGGRLDRRINLQRTGTPTDDGFRTKPGGFATFATVWARVRPAPGTERFASGETAATAPIVFDIRWSSVVADLNPKDRVLFDGRSYDIKSVNEIGRREGLEILGVARAD